MDGAILGPFPDSKEGRDRIGNGDAPGIRAGMLVQLPLGFAMWFLGFLGSLSDAVLTEPDRRDGSLNGRSAQQLLVEISAFAFWRSLGGRELIEGDVG